LTCRICILPIHAFTGLPHDGDGGKYFRDFSPGDNYFEKNTIKGCYNFKYRLFGFNLTDDVILFNGSPSALCQRSTRPSVMSCPPWGIMIFSGIFTP
jgi:hypothetical protein